MMTSDTAQQRFSLIEKIPPSADLHLAAAPFLPAPRPQSPIRRQRSPQHELDSYLSDLEPSLILEALIAKPDAAAAASAYVQTNGDEKPTRQAFIKNAVAGALPSEREWGIKAAKAGKSIREWYAELASWPWPKPGQPNGFGTQYDEDQLPKTISPYTLDRIQSSIPSTEIKAYEMRVKDIRTALSMLELEDLKGHIRDVHVTPNSKRTTQQSQPDTASYEHMDDFQAVITASILQSLPTLARLNALMDTWSLRLVVMRLIPDFMRDMASCEDSMISARMAIGNLKSLTPMSSPRSSMTSSQRKSFSRNVFKDMQAVLDDQIFETGKKLDAILDLLEGSADVLPEKWIDSMDELEEQQLLWAMKAEEVVEDYEGHQSRALQASNDQKDLELDECEVQLLGTASHENRAFTSPTSDSNETSGVVASRAAMSASDESDLSSTHITTAPLVRNVSIGVRKPTGMPKTGELESTVFTPTADLEATSIGQDISTPDLLSSRPRSGSINSDSFSMCSSPEIQSATLAAYPGSPIEVMQSASRRPSLDFNPEIRKSWNGVPSNTGIIRHMRERSSTFSAAEAATIATIATSPSRSYSCYLQSTFNPDRPRPRSASIKSFEVYPRSEVRTIEIRRNRNSSLSVQTLAHDGRPSSRTSKFDYLQNQESEPSGSSSEASAPNLTLARDRFMSDELPSEPKFEPGPHKPKLDIAKIMMSKTRDSSEKGSSLASRIPRAAPQKRAATMNTLSTIKPLDSALNIGDRLDAKISTILTNIPADIRLTSSTEATTTVNNIDNSGGTRSRTSHLSRLSVSRLLRTKSSTSAAMTTPTTITPTGTYISSQHRSNQSSDIKLYHLHRPGIAAPTKLYIRLVGDAGERVMVRVGGGWADLAEYLKEYAVHHSKRAVSYSRFKIQNLPLSSSSSPSPSNSRPSSSSSAAPRHQPVTPTPKKARTILGIGPGPSNSPYPPRTPPSVDSPPPISSAYASDGSPTPGLGLAGPKAKKLDISPRKQAWVDGMMRQARRTSVGGSDGPGSGKGGKGGVRRVFLGRSATKRD